MNNPSGSSKLDKININYCLWWVSFGALIAVSCLLAWGISCIDATSSERRYLFILLGVVFLFSLAIITVFFTNYIKEVYTLEKFKMKKQMIENNRQ